MLTTASRRRKTVVRAIRITEELDETLRVGSESKGISPASLMSSILTKYVEWDRFAEKVGYVAMPRKLLANVIDAPSEENFKKILPLGKEEIRTFMEFWFGQFTPEAFLKAMETIGKYSGMFHAEIRNDGRRFNVTLHHDLGEKWSNYLDEAVKLTLEQLGVGLRSHSATPQSVVFSGEMT